MKLFKKLFISFMTVLISISIVSPKVFASDYSQNNGYYDENGNYYNPETGEYFIWEQNTRSTAKVFSFRIRYSVTSAYFQLNTENARIKVYRATFQNADNTPASCCNDHEFEVDLRRHTYFDTHNKATFYAPFISSQTWNLGGGFFTNAEYYLEINNIDTLPSDVYLAGSGEVYCV